MDWKIVAMVFFALYATAQLVWAMRDKGGSSLLRLLFAAVSAGAAYAMYI